MPQRFLRPGITTSDAWNAASWEAQSFFIRLLTIVDDYGRYDGRIAILHGQCFALRDDINPQRTAALRSELQRLALITIYVVEGKEYLQLSKWQERARGKSRYPDPQSAGIRSAPQESAADGSGILPPSPLVIATVPSPPPSGADESESLPKGFPATVEEAIAQCSTAAVPAEFVSQVWDKAFYRNGLDAKGVAINSFPHYVRTEWRYELDRKGRESAAGGSVSSQIANQNALKRVEAAMEQIKRSYSGHETWSAEDTAEFKALKEEKTRLMKALGLKA